MLNQSEMIIYQTEDGLTKVNVTFEEDTVWLSLEQMAQLFQRDKSVISRHIKKIYTEGELSREGTVAKNATVQLEGQRNVERTVEYYNLDVIISVGYRVKSQRGVQFRIWASGIIKEYMKKGFALDDQRLKELGGGNYFREGIKNALPFLGGSGLYWTRTSGRASLGRLTQAPPALAPHRCERCASLSHQAVRFNPAKLITGKAEKKPSHFWEGVVCTGLEPVTPSM